MSERFAVVFSPPYSVKDGEGIIRVGGRLENALCSFDMKHPIIIPYLSHLINYDAHESTEHGSVQVMMQYVRSKYWIPKLRNELRKKVHRCVICARYNKVFETQLMADLPFDRVNQSRAFLKAGVDFAGPIFIAEHYKRKVSKRKCWIAIFVCVVTRAVHVDAVTDLSAAAFIACYERFIYRRGHCNKFYSDNGTNFVGASKELKIAFKAWKMPEVIEHLNKKGTEWVFMKRAAPHQGGIYEAAVKSMEFHLKRTMGAKLYTYEHLVTILSKIEAILNSRPLYALSDDPMDHSILTPGHFLIGEPLIVPPAIRTPAQTGYSLKRIREEQKKLSEAIWSKWQDEYLTTMLPRKKWLQEKDNFKEGQMVLIKDENLPPANWLMGRIMKLMNGHDGLVRAVKIKTVKNHILDRPVQKNCILPTAPEQVLNSYSQMLKQAEGKFESNNKTKVSIEKN